MYARMFDSSKEDRKETDPHRDFSIRPYALFSSGRLNEVSDRLVFDLTLFGNETASFPFLYRAILNGGKAGMFKERVPYAIEDVTVQGESVLDDGGPKDNVKPRVWRFQNRDKPERKNICIELSSPLRLKASNRLSKHLSYFQIIENLVRRINSLQTVFSGGAGDFWKNEIIDRPIDCRSFWYELPHYSTRQKEAMTIGGLVGVIEIEEPIPAREFSLLKAGELFHVGSKSAFGFGKIRVLRKG